MLHDNLIDVRHLRKSFQEREVVKGIDLCVKKGEIFGFLGPNGSGKTTTIRMLCGLLTPDQGEGTCLGYNILTESEKIKQHLGYMTQKFSFYTDLSVEENLNFIAQVYGIFDRKVRVTETMRDMNLLDRRTQLAGNLSGGWKQRLALAACLLHEPDLLLLDEPTAGIDPMARRDFWDKIHTLSERGITTLMSTHYMDEAERCTRLAYLASGQLVVTGTVDDVIAKTHLQTFELSGLLNESTLLRIKQLDGVMQADWFGRRIHLCGTDAARIEQSLKTISQQESIEWKAIEPTLEDAFIHLVNASKEQLD